MSFTATTYRVLIASPSDLVEERKAAIEAVYEWNAQHAAAESAVLLPVAWETHSIPTSDVRPQDAINKQLLGTADILIGMFWTKLGTNTGVAESGTVEEIDRFVAAGKPVLLYFSNRPIDPNKIDLAQHKRLRQFQRATYTNALVGSFASPDELKATITRHLLAQLRQMQTSKRGRTPKIDEALKLTELMVTHKKHKITPEEYADFRERLLGKGRSGRSPIQTADPIAPGEAGPNGHRVAYTKDGDKVEWIPDDENPGKEWPMILRRNDNAILAASEEFTDRIWYDRKLVFLQNLKEGSESIASDIYEGMLKAMKRTERKYGGKTALREYYSNDFEWGMMNGKLSALRWVMGDEWDMLDT